MKTLTLLASATVLAFASAADGRPGNGHSSGNSQGQGNKHAYGYEKHGQGSRTGYGVGGCPPGLAKKSTACVPPGQARKLNLDPKTQVVEQILNAVRR